MKSFVNVSILSFVLLLILLGCKDQSSDRHRNVRPKQPVPATSAEAKVTLHLSSVIDASAKAMVVFAGWPKNIIGYRLKEKKGETWEDRGVIFRPRSATEVFLLEAEPNSKQRQKLLDEIAEKKKDGMWSSIYHGSEAGTLDAINQETDWFDIFRICRKNIDFAMAYGLAATIKVPSGSIGNTFGIFEIKADSEESTTPVSQASFDPVLPNEDELTIDLLVENSRVIFTANFNPETYSKTSRFPVLRFAPLEEGVGDKVFVEGDIPFQFHDGELEFGRSFSKFTTNAFTYGIDLVDCFGEAVRLKTIEVNTETMELQETDPPSITKVDYTNNTIEVEWSYEPTDPRIVGLLVCKGGSLHPERISDQLPVDHRKYTVQKIPSSKGSLSIKMCHINKRGMIRCGTPVFVDVPDK